MADTPTVSVVIPCYNGGADLPGAIESIEAQTFSEGGVEIVVVDDGSDDPETLRVLAGLEGRVRLVTQPNRGLPAARNAGMRAAQGAFFLPLDCDDRLEPRFIEATFDALDVRPGCAFAFTHMKLAGERQGALRRTYNPFVQRFLNQIPYAMLMRRAVWEETGGYDETMRDGYEDWEFNIRVSNRELVGIVVAEPLFRYTVRAGGMLEGHSSPRHAQLWAEIQRRHPDLYRFSALISGWLRFRLRPSPYPEFMLIGLLMAHRWMAPAKFNRLFARLRRYSGSARADRRVRV
ncbi:MAG: glycosyltransferase family 2 protein [Rhodospirillales bacterium]|nr:glycosyltransferase family 2 protein [Rhodospirillales bacterium]